MLWTRSELKNYAKDFLRKHYWKAFIVCLIFSLLTGNSSNSRSDSNSNSGYTYPENTIEEYIGIEESLIYETGSRGIKDFFSSMGFFPLNFIGASIFSFIIILWIIISLFIGPLLEVGKNRFFLKGFEGDVEIKYLFSTFNREEFWGIFKCMFITGLKNFLWFLLLIIPGIIKSYEYSMVPYLLTKDSTLSSYEAIEISRSLTNGHKWEMFVLDLSFIGWYILGSLLFGLGIFFVTPYHQATIARLYNVLSGDDDKKDEDYSIIYE